VISRRQLLIGGALCLAAGGGAYAALRHQVGPILTALPVGADPDGYVVVAYATNPVSWGVLDPRTGKYVARDGTFAASSPDLHYVLAHDDLRSGSSRILDTGTGAVVHDFGHAWQIPLGWSCDGRHIVLGGVAFHDVQSREDNYFTLDRVGIHDVATGGSRDVARWTSIPLWMDAAPWWTTDGRLVYGDRLIAMGGSYTVSPNADGGSIPMLGTDRVVSVNYDGSAWLTGERTADLVAGTTLEAVPSEIDAKWAGIDYSGLQWLAWLDRDRVICLRDHDLAAVDVRRQARQVFMTFPDLLVTNVLIAPAVGVPATVR
jgi:hypothetical protein